MSRLADKYKSDGLVVLAVNTWDEPKETLDAFVREKNLKYRILLNGRGVGNTYGVTGVPTNVWINPQGIMVDAALDFKDPKKLEEKTKRLLGLDR